MNHGKTCPAKPVRYPKSAPAAAMIAAQEEVVAGSAVATEQASQSQIISVDIVTLKARLFDALLDDIHKVDSLALIRDRWDMIAWMLRIIEG